MWHSLPYVSSSENAIPFHSVGSACHYLGLISVLVVCEDEGIDGQKSRAKRTPIIRPASQTSLFDGQHQAKSKTVKDMGSPGAPAVGPAPHPVSAEDGQHQAKSKALMPLMWLLEGLKGIWQSLAAVSVLLVLLGVITDRWLTEIGEHEKTRGELTREKESNGTVTAERNRLKNELEASRKKNEDLEQLYLILKSYGPGAKLVTNYDLKKEAGSNITFGNCPNISCFRITLMAKEHLRINRWLS